MTLHARFSFRSLLAMSLAAVLLVAQGCAGGKTKSAGACDSCCEDDDKTAKLYTKDKSDGTVALFNGKDLTNWKTSDFGGHKDAKVENGNLVLPVGETLTGVSYTADLPKVNYEVELEAQRVDGSDFFCGLTFPYKDTFASLIIGGWGGGVCGVSSIDGLDASENETTSYRSFEKGKWYKVVLRVTDNKFEAWLDKEKIVDVTINDRRIGIRPEVELSKPFGFSSWQTTAALRNIKLRKVTPPAKE